MIPQTWESPSHIEPRTRTPGDSDPLDYVDLSTKFLEPGFLGQVKILGALCVIDQGETDWKVFGMLKEEAAYRRVTYKVLSFLRSEPWMTTVLIHQVPIRASGNGSERSRLMMVSQRMDWGMRGTS